MLLNSLTWSTDERVSDAFGPPSMPLSSPPRIEGSSGAAVVGTTLGVSESLKSNSRIGSAKYQRTLVPKSACDGRYDGTYDLQISRLLSNSGYGR